MKQRPVDIFVVVAITIITVPLVFFLPPDFVPGRILALPLVFILPGYALTAAWFSEHAPDIPKRLVFSLGISLVVVVLGGLLLNATSFGLRAGSWAVCLGSITLIASIIALVRRRGGSRVASAGFGYVNIRFSLRQGLLLGLAALIVCTAFAVSIVGAQQQPYPGFTQFWLLQASGKKDAVNLGVSNMELTTMKYHLAVNVNGKVVKEWASIDLNVGEQWKASLVLPQASTGTAKVEADLYRASAPKTIYRHVVLWLGS